MIQFRQVSKRYPGHDALHQVTFHLPPGSMTFLKGHSGAGKSTLLKLIGLLEQPSQGQIVIGGQNINHFKKRHMPFYRRKIGMVFQDPHLLYARSVFDNVALPLVISGHFSYREMGRRVRAALDKVQLLGKEKTYPISLSGGECQRVSIARAIISKPQIILADEPTGNLDRALALDIMQLFAQFNQVGATILIATHDEALMANSDNAQITLKQGQIST